MNVMLSDGLPLLCGCQFVCPCCVAVRWSALVWLSDCLPLCGCQMVCPCCVAVRLSALVVLLELARSAFEKHA